jgi:hypothetical protein
MDLPISYDHRHYCDAKIFCYGKKDFRCKFGVKFKNAGHDDRCDDCDRMITAYFDDEEKVMFVNRIEDFFTRAEYEKFMREHNEKKK